MSRLLLVDPSQAQGKTHDLFEAIKAKLGRVPNMMKAMANSPAVLEGYLALSGALGSGSLDPKVGERISIELAEHTLLGKLAGLDETERQSARLGESADPKADAALKFARTVLDRRGDVGEEDLRRVKEAGYGDGEVAEILALVALNILTNYFNVAFETPIDFPAVPPLPA
jgi:alkylhydroperoxidase family enzyme